MTTAPAGRRRLDTSVPQPYEMPTRAPRVASARARQFVIATLAVWVLGSLGALTSIVDLGAPAWLWRPSAALLLVVFAVVLTHRIGGQLRIWASLAALLAVAAWVTGFQALLASAAGATAVLAAVTSVMLTRPAATALQSVREFAVMLAIAVTGTVAVAAWNADADPRTFALAVMAVAVMLTLSIVWRLGSGLHGLSRHHLNILVVVAVIAVGLFFYGAFVRSYGSPALKDLMDDTIAWMRQNTGGVPRPYEFLVGFPAIIVGTSMRSRYREGWWVCMFAVVGAVIVTVSLIDPKAYPSYFLWSTLYSAALGLVIGLAVRALVMAPRTRRAARAVQQPTRSEPVRVAPLT